MVNIKNRIKEIKEEQHKASKDEEPKKKRGIKTAEEFKELIRKRIAGEDEPKYNSKESIEKVCEENNIVFSNPSLCYEQIEGIGLGAILHNELIKFIKRKAKNGFYILEVINPENEKEIHYVSISYEGNKEEEVVDVAEEKEDVVVIIYSLLLQKKRGEATELIVKEFMKNNFIDVTRDDKNPEFYIYKEGIRVPQGKTYIEEYCRKILGEAYSTQLFNDVCIKISADNKVDFENYINTNYPYEIAVKNGILNLKTNSLKPFTPEKIFFNKLPIRYDPKSKAVKILKFLNEILGEENVKLILELFGFSMVKDYFLEIAFMFVGGGRNGKGKLLELFKRFLGVENTCSVRLQEMNTQSSSICELFNKLVNLAGDLNSTSLKETGLFKEITGRDTIQAKRKYYRDLKFVNFSKQIFACNDPPRVYDNSTGFWSRWILINFPYEFVDKKHYDNLNAEERKFKKIKNPGIINEILSEEELSGLLNLALDGLKTIRENKSFSYSNSAEEVKREWVRKADSFIAFCMDNVEEDFEGKIQKKTLKRLYNKYRKTFKLKNVSDISMKITLEERYGVSEYQEHGGERFWEGIKIIENPNVTGETGVPNTYSKNNLHDFIENGVTPVTSKNSISKSKDNIDFNKLNIEELKDE